jgi:hypothetical protein
MRERVKIRFEEKQADYSRPNIHNPAGVMATGDEREYNN